MVAVAPGVAPWQVVVVPQPVRERSTMRPSGFALAVDARSARAKPAARAESDRERLAGIKCDAPRGESARSAVNHRMKIRSGDTFAQRVAHTDQYTQRS
jgi:hypothetical protein